MAPRTVTFHDLKGLRERVSDDLIDASGSANPNRRQVRMLTQLRGDVDNLIEAAGRSSTDPTFPERYAQFRRAYFTDYIEPFEQGAAFKVRARDGRAFYKTTDEKVADAFFKAGDTTAADQFNSIFANRPEARAALRASVVDSFRQAAVRDGVLDQARFAAWLREHRSVLARFPEIMGDLRNVATADAAYIRRQAQLAGRQKTIEDQMLTRAVNGYARGATADSLIDAALKEPRKMAQLVGTVRRTDGALASLRRTVWDRATEGDATAIARFTVRHEPALRALFSPNHLQDIHRIASARAMLSRVPDPQGAAYIPRPLEQVEKLIGQGLPQLSSRVFAFKSGRMQKEYLIIDTLLRSMRGRALVTADQALKVALYDPQIARDLASTLGVGGMTPLKAKRIQSRMIALGIPLLDRDDGTDEHRQ